MPARYRPVKTAILLRVGLNLSIREHSVYGFTLQNVKLPNGSEVFGTFQLCVRFCNVNAPKRSAPDPRF